jgi:DNA-binding transcriptional LysR family regulator
MNFAGFDLNLLRVLDALLQEESTVREGERAGLSQPAPLIAGIWHRRSDANPAHVWMRARIAEILRPLDEGEEPL